MKYKPGDIVIFKIYSAVIRFCYADYKDGKNAYSIRFTRKNGTTIDRLCFEDELNVDENAFVQTSLFDEL